MKVYLINLDRSSDRMEHMRAECARVGIKPTRIAAVDGAQFPQGFLQDFACRRPRFSNWKVGSAACFLSHVLVWKKIAAGGEEVAAIFEDDVHLAADTGAMLASGDWLPRNADLVRLESNSPMVLKGARRIAVCPDRFLYRAVSRAWGSAGYIVTKQAVRRLLDAPEDQHHALDVFLFDPAASPTAAGLKRYQVKPAICIQDELLHGRDSTLKSVIGNEFPSFERLQSKKTNWLKRRWPRHKEPVPFRP